MTAAHELDLKPVPGTPPAKNTLTAMKQMRTMANDVDGYVRAGFARYGDIFSVNMMGETHVLIHHPDHLHELLVAKADHFHKSPDYTDPKRGLARFVGTGLLTSDGEFWKRQRKLAAPALHATRISGYADTMVDATERLIERWGNGGVLDIDREMMTATLEIVTRSLFHTDVGAESDRIADAMSALQEFSSMPGIAEMVLPPWVPTPRRQREAHAVRALDEIVYGVMGEWREEGRDRGDLLSMLLLARDDEGQPMTDRQARDEIVTLFLAGHETTANTMNFLLALLAQHPDVEARLHEELDRVLGGRTPGVDDLRELTYTDAVVREVLRLYPVAFTYSRVAITDTSIGGFAIPAGTQVEAYVWSTHRDPRWWDEPEAFRPERFLPENSGQLRRYAYLPFGAGPRVCIGNNFALMEAQIMTAMIASRYRLRLAPGQSVEPKPQLTLRPKGGLTMYVEVREPAREVALP